MQLYAEKHLLDEYIPRRVKFQEANRVAAGRAFCIGWSVNPCGKEDLNLDIYVVRSDDTLWNIARRYGVSAESLAEINQLRNPALLSVGQALLIPREDQRYTVRQGDTLWAIARRYDLPVACLIGANPQIADPNRIRPGQILRIPLRSCAQGEILVNGYISGAAAASLEAQLPYLSFLSPFAWRADGEGGLTRDMNVDTDMSGAYGTANLLTVTNQRPEGGFSGEIAHALFRDQAVQDRFLENLEAALAAGEYYGLNLDFEYIFPYDREAYNAFLQRLADRLHCLGYLLVTALAPKSSDSQQGLLYTAHDYAAHGKAADYVVLMTYEWGYTYGPPMAVAPIDRVRQVLDYAVSVMPAGRILLGVPNYGYDWTLPFRQGSAARVLTNTGAVTLAGQAKAAIEYDPRAQAPFFRYSDSEGRQHEVWFEDARSLRAKYALVSEYGLGGVSFWNLNSLWRAALLLLGSMYGVEKLV